MSFIAFLLYNVLVSGLLLQTKLFKPSLRPSLIARPQLIEKLNSALGIGAVDFAPKLLLVSAPAGAGKTTLVSSWLEQLNSFNPQFSSERTAWLSLDENDNDLVRFLAYLIAAMQTAAPDFGQTAAQILQSPRPPAAETILTLLINEISQKGQPLILVLQDYHLITILAVHRALAFLLEHLPPSLHLVLTTRSDPPLNLSRLRAGGQIVEIREYDLRFNLDEIRRFFHEAMGLKLSETQLVALEQRTEGWIAGLQLAALSMQGRDDLDSFITDFTGSNRLVLDYLTNEVLDRRPKGTRNFLLHTAVLDRLCGPLCDAVIGRPGGQATLERLEQANLFLIPLDDKRNWYRYHHLFGDILQAHLRKSQAELIPELHRRASDWYEEKGLMAEAVQHARDSGDVNRTAGLIERERWALLGRGEINTLHSWLAELPEEIVRARPLLSLTYGWIYSLLEQAEAIEPRLLDAETALAIISAEIPGSSAEIDAIRGEIATLRADSALSRADIPAAIESCQQALKLLPTDNVLMRGVATYFLGHAHRRSGRMAEAEQAYIDGSTLGLEVDNLLLALHALSYLSMVQIALGRLDEASASSQRILGITGERRRQSWPVTGLAYQGLGRLHYEWDELDAAVDNLRLGIEFGQRGGLIGLEINSRMALAFALNARHDQDGADQMLRHIREMNERHHHPVYTAVAEARRARLRSRQGRLEEAVRWSERCGLHLDDGELPYLMEEGYLTLAAIFIAHGETAGVLHLLHRLQQAAERDQRVSSLIEIQTLRALALQVQADMDEALTALERALHLAEPAGYVRTFVDEGEPLRALLFEYRAKQVRLSGSNDGGKKHRLLTYTNKLLAAFPSPVPQEEPLQDLLSEREMEVLALIANGASNRDIADMLVVALSTVKKHVSNIMSKLNASSRTQAVAEARNQGLL